MQNFIIIIIIYIYIITYRLIFYVKNLSFLNYLMYNYV